MKATSGHWISGGKYKPRVEWAAKFPYLTTLVGGGIDKEWQISRSASVPGSV